MTQIRKGTFIRNVKDIGIGTALAMTLFSGTYLSSCNPANDEAAYSYEETSYTKGIRSYIKEVKPGEFKITDEEAVDAAKSLAIVTYMDGHTDSLSTTAAKALIDGEIKAQQSGGYHSNGLSSMLLYGGLGYMLASRSGNGYMNNYRNDDNRSRAAYANSSAYNSARNAVSSVNGSRVSRTVNSRPAGGRNGFFGRSPGSSGG